MVSAEFIANRNAITRIRLRDIELATTDAAPHETEVVRDVELATTDRAAHETEAFHINAGDSPALSIPRSPQRLTLRANVQRNLS